MDILTGCINKRRAIVREFVSKIPLKRDKKQSNYFKKLIKNSAILSQNARKRKRPLVNICKLVFLLSLSPSSSHLPSSFSSPLLPPLSLPPSPSPLLPPISLPPSPLPFLLPPSPCSFPSHLPYPLYTKIDPPHLPVILRHNTLIAELILSQH